MRRSVQYNGYPCVKDEANATETAGYAFLREFMLRHTLTMLLPPDWYKPPSAKSVELSSDFIGMAWNISF